MNKIDTEENWIAENPVLLSGELAIVKCGDGNIKIKFGDGVSSYNSLSFFSQDGSSSSSAFISGMVILWSGSADNVPSGWALCNGENGTPDLRDKFVVGAGLTYQVGSEGGEARHVLTKDEMPSHSHAIKSDINNSAYNQTWPAWTEYTTGWTQQANSTETAPTYTQTAGGDTAHNNLPPYYALCYIMKT